MSEGEMAARSIEELTSLPLRDVAGIEIDPYGHSKLVQLAEFVIQQGSFQVGQGPGTLQIFPNAPDGFPVLLQIEGDICIAWIGGLIQEFYNIDEAVLWVERIIAGRCRLKVERRRSKPHSWTLQLRTEGGQWIDGLSSSYVTLLPAWLAGHSTIDYYYMDPATPSLHRIAD